MKLDWKPESIAPFNTYPGDDETYPVLVWVDGYEIAVAYCTIYNNYDPPHRCWWINNSHGFNEDGQIYDVTHWVELPEGPSE